MQKQGVRRMNFSLKTEKLRAKQKEIVEKSLINRFCYRRKKRRAERKIGEKWVRRSEKFRKMERNAEGKDGKIGG